MFREMKIVRVWQTVAFKADIVPARCPALVHCTISIHYLTCDVTSPYWNIFCRKWWTNNMTDVLELRTDEQYIPGKIKNKNCLFWLMLHLTPPLECCKSHPSVWITVWFISFFTVTNIRVFSVIQGFIFGFNRCSSNLGKRLVEQLDEITGHV